MAATPGIGKLKTIQVLTLGLVFGTIAFLLGLGLLYSGARGASGILLAFILACVMMLIQWLIGPSIIRAMSRMREVGPQEAPNLHEVVERISRQAGIKKPKLYLVEDNTPNAFAFGRTQSSSCIAIHKGLLNILDEDEVEGVIAHEIGHIKHRDVLVMTMASVLPIFLYYVIMIMGSGRRDDRGRGPNILLLFLGAQIASFMGRLLVLWLSRQREYYADAFSAINTGKPAALMSGLAKITYNMPAQKTETQESLSAFYISDPSIKEKQAMVEIVNSIGSRDDEKLRRQIEAEKKKSGMELLMSHPLTAKRLESLNQIRRSLGQ